MNRRIAIALIAASTAVAGSAFAESYDNYNPSFESTRNRVEVQAPTAQILRPRPRRPWLAEVPPGDVQRMSAGTGVQHSEFNHAKDRTTHILQIWILPKFKGVRPGYEQKTVPEQDKRGKLRLVASPDGASDSVSINADARMYAGLFDGTEEARMQADPDRKYYVHLVRGELEVNGQRLQAGDAAMLEDEAEVRLSSGRQAEVLVFDLAP